MHSQIKTLFFASALLAWEHSECFQRSITKAGWCLAVCCCPIIGEALLGSRASSPLQRSGATRSEWYRNNPAHCGQPSFLEGPPHRWVNVGVDACVSAVCTALKRSNAIERPAQAPRWLGALCSRINSLSYLWSFPRLLQQCQGSGTQRCCPLIAANTAMCCMFDELKGCCQLNYTVTLQ